METCCICQGQKVQIIFNKRFQAEEIIGVQRSLSMDIFLCRGCGYIFQKNNLSPSEIQAYYQSFSFNFSTQSPSGEDQNAIQSEREAKALDRYRYILRFFPWKPEKGNIAPSLIEIGCGDGQLLHQFKQNGFKVKGIELNKNLAGQCIAKGLDVSDADTLDTLLASENQYDLILASHVLEHIESPELFMEKIRALMKDETAMVFIEVPDEAAMTSAAAFSLEHISYFTQPALNRLFQKSDLCILTQDKVSYSTTPDSIRTILYPRQPTVHQPYLDHLIEELTLSSNRIERKMAGLKLTFSNKRVALFCAGTYARDLIKTAGIAPEVIFDNNPAKAGTTLSGFPVQNIAQRDLHDFEVIIIASMGSGQEIKNQLRQLEDLASKPIYLLNELLKLSAPLPEPNKQRKQLKEDK